jgi:agmatine deiminase
MAAAAGARIRSVELVAEGGAFEFDGEGTVITTRDCLLNANRNPGLSEAAAEDVLKAALGVERAIWLDEGLVGDHTDGHVDNLARFVRPGLVVCQAPSGRDDPQAKRLEAVARQLARAIDAQGRRLRVVRIPSPGRVMDAETGGPAAASHMNYVIGARHVVMPAYTEASRAAAQALQRLFPDRKVAACSARHILTGGGAFHCVTSNQPAAG